MILLLLVVPVFVGNEACAACHAQINRTYLATPMAQSSGKVAAVASGAFEHVASRTQYRIDATGAVSVQRQETRSERRLEYFIGSGAAGRSFLYNRDGFLFQAPITWYAQKTRWDVSPGYEKDSSSRWSRPIEPSCLFCHASETRHIGGTQNQYQSPPFTGGITCERCHGPGSEHVRGTSKMVNPAKLDPPRRDAVCAQCHLSGEARIDRAGRRIADYRPGESLPDYVAYFVFEGGQSALKATSHVEKLNVSRCKQVSGDRLWCGTCHDPHSLPASGERAAWYKAKCLSCHRPAQCARGPDCASCHMPRGQVVDGGHGVLTDHSIPRRSLSMAFEAARNWRLAPFSPRDVGERELGLAYAEVFLRTGNGSQRDEALRLLERAGHDPAVQLRLADLYQRRGDIARAAPLYQAVLTRDAGSTVALVNLGAILGGQGRLRDAIPLWRRALAANPCLQEAAQNLITALRFQGDDAGADGVHRSSACD